VKEYGKPILIAEVGSVAQGGNKSNWYRDMFHDLATGSFPLIKGAVMFDLEQATTPEGMPADLSFTGYYDQINREELITSLHARRLHKGGKK